MKKSEQKPAKKSNRLTAEDKEFIRRSGEGRRMLERVAHAQSWSGYRPTAYAQGGWQRGKD